MFSFDSAFSDQPPDESVSSNLVSPSHEDIPLETLEQQIADKDTVNTNVLSLNTQILSVNDLALKVIKESEVYKTYLDKLVTPMYTPLQGFGSLFQFDSPEYTSFGLAGISTTASLIEDMVNSANLHAQLRFFAENQISASIQAFSKSFADLYSSTLNDSLHGAVEAVWSTIPAMLPQFDSALDIFSRNISPTLNLSSMFPSVRLMDQFQVIDSFLPKWDLIADLTKVINTSIGAIPDLFKRFKEELKQRILAAFKRIRFCLAPSMPEELVYDVLEKVEAGNSNTAIESLLGKYYAQNRYTRLQQMVERWLDNPEFTRRRDIIWAAFKNHKRKDYISSIKVLAPEIEGISKQVLIQNTPLKSPEGRAGLAQFHSPKLTIIGAIHEVVDKAQIDSPNLDIISWVSFKSTVSFAEDEFIKKMDFNAHYSDLRNGQYPHNRHGIAHGLQLAGYSAPNSLRLFMMLDAMYELFQNYISKGGFM